MFDTLKYGCMHTSTRQTTLYLSLITEAAERHHQSELFTVHTPHACDYCPSMKLHTCQHLKISMGENARELLRQPRTGQRDLCGRILGIVLAYEIMNETTRKLNSNILLAHHNI